MYNKSCAFQGNIGTRTETLTWFWKSVRTFENVMSTRKDSESYLDGAGNN